MLQSVSTFTDFRLTDRGSVMLLQPITEEADAWVRSHVQAEPWYGGNLIIPMNLIGGVIDGITEAGLRVVAQW